MCIYNTHLWWFWLLIDFTNLQLYSWASTVKLIQNWQPTFAPLCHKNQKRLPNCPWCLISIEDLPRVSQFLAPTAIKWWKHAPQAVLTTLVQTNTPIHIIATMEAKLSNTLTIPYRATFTPSTYLLPLNKTSPIINAIFVIKKSSNGTFFLKRLYIHTLVGCLWCIVLFQ